jgi:hypothetical protein
LNANKTVNMFTGIDGNIQSYITYKPSYLTNFKLTSFLYIYEIKPEVGARKLGPEVKISGELTQL